MILLVFGASRATNDIFFDQLITFYSYRLGLRVYNINPRTKTVGTMYLHFRMNKSDDFFLMVE